MASVKKYKTAHGHAWRVQYRSPDGRSRTKQGFRTKDAAQKWADTNAAALHDGSWLDPQAGKITVNQLGEQWLTHQSHLTASSLRTVTVAWRTHVQPKWGDRMVASITPSEVQSWVAGEITGAAATVRKAHSCLAQILDIAVMDGRIRANPARGVKLPRKGQGVKVYLTPTQVKRLADACSKHQELVWLLATTGLRWGEAAGLQCQDVDVLKCRISVERNAVTVGGEIVVGEPKTHERRVVAVTKRVMGMLVEGPMRGKGPGDFLWQAQGGGPMRLPGHHSFFAFAVGRCMDEDPAFPRVTLHGLRHVAAGLLVSAGANVKVVQRQLGHKSAAMTLDVYSDLFEDDLESVAVVMDGVLDAAYGAG